MDLVRKYAMDSQILLSSQIYFLIHIFVRYFLKTNVARRENIKKSKVDKAGALFVNEISPHLCPITHKKL